MSIILSSPFIPLTWGTDYLLPIRSIQPQIPMKLLFTVLGTSIATCHILTAPKQRQWEQWAQMSTEVQEDNCSAVSHYLWSREVTKVENYARKTKLPASSFWKQPPLSTKTTSLQDTWLTKLRLVSSGLSPRADTLRGSVLSYRVCDHEQKNRLEATSVWKTVWSFTCPRWSCEKEVKIYKKDYQPLGNGLRVLDPETCFF